jgi:L-seryl-tRNA(Ser) seleniumtransferase
MAGEAESLLRELPSVDRLLKHERAAPLMARYNRQYVTDKCRETLQGVRAAIRHGEAITVTEDALLDDVEARVTRESRPGHVRVVNATGTILHTNLGRALLAPEAIEAASAASRYPINLEFDLELGRRGRREETLQNLIVELTGAEAATVVNNNAAAVLLALNTLAQGKEVIVSRGELIEIGGAFRIPEIMAKSGATLKEVGSTNRTHPADYENAIGEKTALLLKVHTSNYKVVGFTAEVGLEELVAIGKRHRLPVMEDLGSGALVDLTRYGLPKEPLVGERIAAGADLVTFSGDKILGGPQAGIMAGGKELIGRINKNHLQRALRCGKITLAALEATLRLYRQAPDITRAIPTLRAFTRPLDEIRAAAETAAARLRGALGGEFRIELEESTSQIGSGALPTEELPTFVLAVTHADLSAAVIGATFRGAHPPIIGRIKDDRFLLDLRTIFDPEELVPKFD